MIRLQTAFRKSTILVSLVFFAYACGSDGPGEPPSLTELSITSSTGDWLDVTTQETTTLSVEGIDQFGNSIPIESSVTWSSNNSNVSVDSDGIATALVVGTSEITAEVESLEATYTIEVWDSSAPRTEIYVSDVGENRNGPHQILKYNSDGERGEVFISDGLSRPQDIVFLEDMEMALVSNFGGNNITMHNFSTGALLGTFAGGLNGPTRIDIGPDNLLYVLQWNSGPVKRYNLDGTFVDDYTSTSVNEAIGMAWDAQGNFYVSSFNNGSNGFVKKFDGDGNDLGFFINTNLSGPTDIWFDDSGNLFVNDWSGNSVKKFGADGAFLSTFISSVSQPEGVAFFDNGDVLIGESASGSVKQYNLEGTFIKDLVASGDAGLTTTNAVVLRKVNQ